MSSPIDTHSLVVNYLLGRMSETELDRFERDYLTNEDLFNELQEVEEELIDDYANGALTAEQSESFEKYFLRSPERREKLAFASAMTERAVVWQSGTLVSTDRPVLDPTLVQSPHYSSSFWRRPVPAWRQWLAIAAAIVLAFGLGIFWLRDRELQRQLKVADDNYARLRQEVDTQSKMTAETKLALAAEQQQTQLLESQVEQLQSSPADKIGATIINIVLGIDYLISSTRGGAEKKVKTVAVSPDARVVRLNLNVGASSFDSLNILLRRNERVVWRRTALKTKAAGDLRKLNLSIPAEILTPGDYEVLLLGAPTEGDAQLIGRYFLKIESKRATK